MGGSSTAGRGSSANAYGSLEAYEAIAFRGAVLLYPEKVHEEFRFEDAPGNVGPDLPRPKGKHAIGSDHIFRYSAGELVGIIDGNSTTRQVGMVLSIKKVFIREKGFFGTEKWVYFTITYEILWPDGTKKLRLATELHKLPSVSKGFKDSLL